MANKVLGGRYILQEKVGGGGMAVVYKATDTILNRTVAIKLLRNEFSNDQEFVKNFDNEAQAAASLSHPNVVNIFDVGKDGDNHYIVMEFIDGKTLKEVIQERAPLPSAEVVEIAKQICDALEHAHQNHIIHRDIKPHNIMINKVGMVKVTDFGIARAVTSSTITYQAESVLGSVHYFSPEQARGGAATESSDIYSLGIVMYELLTGRLPFSGDSPISIALKHLQDELTDPSVYNQDIPTNLENIILKALAKNPLNRYKTAEQMASDLLYALKKDNYIPRIDTTDEHGQFTKVIPIIQNDNPQLLADNKNANKQSKLKKDKTDYDESNSIFDKLSFRIGIAAFFVVIITVLSVYLYKSFLDILYVPEVQIPSVEGEQIEDAINIFIDAGFNIENIEEKYQINRDVDEGYVFRQTPVADSSVKVNFSPITLYVSLGKEKIEMPNLIGLTSSRAKLLLDQKGIKVEIKEEHRDNVPEGEVYDQIPHPNAEIIAEDTRAVMYISKGLKSFKMPNLISKSLNEAERIIHDKQLVRGIIHQESSYVIPQGEIMKQSPFQEDDEVSKGEIIDLWVSSGFPDDAKFYEETIYVQPTSAGEKTDVVIKVNDARGKDQTFYQRTIVDEEIFNVQIVLAPNTFGVIEVYLNGVFVDSRAVSY